MKLVFILRLLGQLLIHAETFHFRHVQNVQFAVLFIVLIIAQSKSIIFVVVVLIILAVKLGDIFLLITGLSLVCTITSLSVLWSHDILDVTVKVLLQLLRLNCL